VPGRNAPTAWRAFVEPIERAVGAVDLTIRLKSKVVTQDLYILSSGDPGISLQRTSGHLLHLYFALNLRPVEEEGGAWRMTTLRYDFALRDRDSTVFSWQWHPRSRRSPVGWPHLHLPEGTRFGTKHVPTGRISLEDLLIFALDELDVRPSYENARSVLEDVAMKHKEHRTWS
jgi:hypothetical protein